MSAASAPGSRTGLGWDSHRFKAGRRLILGGVEFEGAELGLDGHSDADVLTHAVMDALLGAAGLDDIGVQFPDSDGAYEGADSIALLGEVVARLRADGLRIVHVDTTVLMERPKLGPHRGAMRDCLAGALGLDRAAVNVKASTGEGMGFVGRLEGVGALAIATVVQDDMANDDVANELAELRGRIDALEQRRVLEAERIDIVEADGTVRLVISNTARAPDPVATVRPSSAAGCTPQDSSSTTTRATSAAGWYSAGKRADDGLRRRRCAAVRPVQARPSRRHHA